MIAEAMTALIELQELDREIYSLRTERANKPEALKALKMELEAIQKRYEEAENELEAYRSRQRLLEGEVSDHEAQIAKLSNQLNEVKNNKEYQAMLHDIESVKASRRQVEERILESMDHIEQIKQQIGELKKEVDRKQERLDDEEKEVMAIVGEIDEELADLEKERAEKIEPVPAEALATYERLLGNAKGQALAEVESQTCTGCYSHLPLNLINRLHIGESFVICPSCNRILYER